MSIFALYVSWDSNQISRKANSPQIIVLDVSTAAFNFVEFENPEFFESQGLASENIAHCTTQIRVANLGGAATSITGFELVVSFGDQVLRAVSNGSNQVWSTQRFLPGFVGLTSYFVPPESAGATYPSVLERQNLPISVGEYAALTLFNEVVFIGDDNFRDEFMTSMLNAFNNPERPLVLSYVLELPDGERITTPGTLCSTRISGFD
ncbi:MAG: hypothetical protein IIA89_05205 [Chloroflexi bacterium]|nr:hypothetical protein [Chloroflexota bacterium]